ncbi:MAG: DUF2516 family protein [Acidimicrobiales bacterium]|nr:DUF2516 family protein [Acidimicrobiales bacterium]
MAVFAAPMDGLWRLVVTVVSIAVFAVPLALSVWALLDAANRPEWAFALAGRRRVVWIAAPAIGVLFLLPGLVIALWYLLTVRPHVAAAERGDVR